MAQHAATGSFFGLSSIFPISSHTERRICHLSSNKCDAATVLCHCATLISEALGPSLQLPSVLERKGLKQAGMPAASAAFPALHCWLRAFRRLIQWTTHDALRFGFGSHRCRASKTCMQVRGSSQRKCLAPDCRRSECR